MTLSLVLSYWFAQVVVGGVSLPWKVLKIQRFKANKENPTTTNEEEIPGNSDALVSCQCEAKNLSCNWKMYA